MKNRKTDRAEKCHVLMVYRRMIPSIYLCGYCQMQYLDGMGEIEFRSRVIWYLSGRDMDWADVVFMGRSDSWMEERLAKKLSKANKYLIYVIDDDLLNIPDTLLSAPHYRQDSVRQHIRNTMNNCSAILSPSEKLLEKYANQEQRTILIEEPAVHIVPFQLHEPSQPIRIGFAGSLDRSVDLETMLGSVLRNIKARYGSHVQFEFFGAIPSFAKDIQANVFPYCDSYEEYLEALGNRHWDIGLAPMPDTVFHACKHHIKYIEYAGIGAVGIYSDVSPYREIREKHYPGLYCSNEPEAWEKALCMLIENGQKREELRRAAYEWASNMLTIDAKMEHYLQNDPIVTVHQADKTCMLWNVQLLKMGQVINCAWLSIRKYGWRLPWIGVKKLLQK